MSTQDITGFLADIQKLKDQADSQSADNPRFAIASQKLDELLIATKSLDETVSEENTVTPVAEDATTEEASAAPTLKALATDQTPTTEDAKTGGVSAELTTDTAESKDDTLDKPVPLTQWWHNKDNNQDAETTDKTTIVSTGKSGFFTKFSNKKKLAKEPATLRTARKVAASKKSPLVSIKTPQNNILTSSVNDDKTEDSTSLAGAAAAGIAGAATLAAVVSSTNKETQVTETDAAPSEIKATSNDESNSEPVIEDSKTTNDEVQIATEPTATKVEAEKEAVTAKTAPTVENNDTTEINTPDISQEAALYAKASAGQFEDRAYEKDHVKMAAAPEDMPAEKELLTSVSQGDNNDGAALTATTAAAIVSGQELEPVPVAASETPEIEAIPAATEQPEGTEEVSVEAAAVPADDVPTETPMTEAEAQAENQETVAEVMVDDVNSKDTATKTEIVVEEAAPEAPVLESLSEAVTTIEPEQAAVNLAAEHTPEPEETASSLAPLAAAGAVAAAGLASATLSNDDAPLAPAEDQHLSGVIEISDPQPGEPAALAALADEAVQTEEQTTELQTKLQTEPQLEFAQELPENGLVSSTVLSSPIDEAANTLEKPSVQDILTQPSPTAASLESQTEHDIDISHITGEQISEPAAIPEAAPVAETPALDSATPIIPEGAPVIEAPVLEDITPAVPEAAPVAETPALDSATPIIPEGAPVIEAPVLEDITPAIPEAAPVAETPALDSATPIIPEGAPVIEAPALEDITPAIPEAAPVAETPALDSATPIIPQGAPEIGGLTNALAGTNTAPQPDSVSPLANIPLTSPAVGENVLVSQPADQSVNPEVAAISSHTIPTAQQDGVKTSDLAINSEKVILSGDDIKFHPEYGAKKKGFFSRLFGKDK